MEFRLLRADEIDVRVGTVRNGSRGGYVTLLLYQDARCAMDILDETVGSMNWQRDHKEVKGNMYAGIGIWDSDKSAWVWKWDCGTESNTEKEKGESSDSFKRAAVNWGIARELYTAGEIRADAEVVPSQRGSGYDLKNKFQFYGVKVSNISYNFEREIVALTIVDKNGNVIFQKGKQPQKEVEFITATDAQVLKRRLEETDSDVKKFLSFVGKKSGFPADTVDSLTKEQFIIAMNALDEKERKAK